ncbi:MAG: hypothetical protein WCW53_10995 [Syntrophales bacterium]|jgi:hypothetical protein
MDPIQMMKKMVDFNKMAFEKTFSVMTVMQDQTEKTFILWRDRNKLFPEQGKTAMSEWVKICKKNRDEFKAKIDEGYTNIEKYFAGFEK